MKPATSKRPNNVKDLSDKLVKLDINSPDILSNVIGYLKKHIKFDAATIYWFNQETDLLEKLYSYSQDVEVLIGLHNEFGDGLSGWSAETNNVILINDRTKKKSYNPEEDFASFLSVPILRGSSLTGVINFGSFVKNTFIENDVNLIKSVSLHVSYLISHFAILQKNMRMHSEYTKSINQLNELEKQAVKNSTAEIISTETAEVIHGINNSLSIIIGNLQCLLIGKSELNQKSLSRLKRIESAAKKLSESNKKIMNLNSLVKTQSEEI